MNLFLRQTVASALDDVLTSRSLPRRTRSTAVTALSDTLCLVGVLRHGEH